MCVYTQTKNADKSGNPGWEIRSGQACAHYAKANM